MNKWQETLLGDLVEINHGYPFDSLFFSDVFTDYILVTPANFKPGGGFDNSRFKYYKAANDSSSNQYILKPGDIIIALTDLSREINILGYSARIPEPNQPGQKFLHNQRIGLVVPLIQKIDSNFLYWLMRSDNYRTYVISTATGSTVKHTSPGRIKDFRFLLPPLEKQKAIAAYLDAIENRINSLQNYEAILENVILHYFRKCFENSSEYELKPLADFGRIICGKTPPKESSLYFGGPIPFIKIPDLKRCVYVIYTIDSFTQLGAAFQPAKQIPPNTICVSCIATVGLVALTSTWCHTNQQINSIIPNHYRQRYYLYCYLRTAVPQLKVLSTGGSTTLNLNTGQFSQLLIPEPPQSVLEKFYQTVHPFFQGILLRAQQAKHLILLRNSVLTGLITGKIVLKNF